ncbi:MAG TPA: metal-dependent hydrolase [Blastocatellia bacterium]|nr:metal-dependent hydrolase [Blastocatellia bacterium]
MPSALTHPAVPIALRFIYPEGQVPARFLATGIVCSVIPDLDVIGFRFGIRYEDMLGHRGLTHSILFAALLSAVTFAVLRRPNALRSSGIALFIYLFLSAASHGFLDSFTNGGLGVAFFAPFSDARYFMPWTPIEVSPIGAARFFSSRGVQIIKSEILWVWVPCLTVAVLSFLSRKMIGGERTGDNS